MNRLVLASMLAVAVAFISVITFGFWIHEQTTAINDDLFGVLAALAITLISFVLVFRILKIPIRPYFRHTRRYGVNVPIVPNLAEQMAYSENPNTTASCVHLQPVELAMRQAGVDVRLLPASQFGPVVQAACCINEAHLRRAFSIPMVLYKEGYQPERSPLDNPRADLFCSICLETDRAHADILVLHPDECRPDTLWFPSPISPLDER